MSVLPVSHFEWQVLRTIKRSHRPPTGRVLRLLPTRNTRDGSFLSQMVERGLLARVTGTAEAPFAATYALTELGEHAAEYGECDFPARSPVVVPSPHESNPLGRMRRGKNGSGQGR
jgi:hypothetical protein